MAKSGLKVDQLPSLRGKIRDSGWVLCVGAGISRSVFPDWATLVQMLMKEDSSISDPNRLFESLKKEGFSLDAMIQATRARLGLTEELFVQKLSSCLYSQLPPSPKREQIIRCLSAKHPGELTISTWQVLIEYVESFGDSAPSALALSRVVTSAYQQGVRPSAILSFNAEPLLYALINARAAMTCEKTSINARVGVPAPALLDKVTRSTSSHISGRMPYYFCHGLLRVDGARGGLLQDGSPEKLVFSEGEYLDLANSVFSWQAAAFTSLALSHSMIFVGLSFTDSNLRKWLSWLYTNRAREIRDTNAQREKRLTAQSGKVQNRSYDEPGSSTAHYWLRAEPKVPEEKEWIESLVAHLGVRIVWLDRWGQIGDALASIVGVRK